MMNQKYERKPDRFMNMKTKIEQKGFSLLEVMFSMMILTLGMVFIASMFPVGLYTSRDVVDSTMNALESHNAQVMTEIRLGELKQQNSVDYNAIIQTNHKPPFNTPPFVVPIVKPNYLIDDNLVVLDGEDYFYGPDDPQSPYPPYITADGGMGLLDLRNIGSIVSPAVDATDPAVVKKLSKLTNWDWLDQDRAILDVALDRKYCWAALRKDNMYYIFILRNFSGNIRYAVQHKDSYEPSGGLPYDPPALAPEPAAADEDRQFPVPWRIFLGRYFRFAHVNPGDSDYHDPILPLLVPENVANILRPGSILVDADPADKDGPPGNEQTTGQCGEIYEVMDVNTDGTISLKTPLRDDLHYVWVFPPPIERTGINDYKFANQQPVISVTTVQLDLE